MSFTLSCLESNDKHTKFVLLDSTNVHCGVITVLTTDVKDLITRDWYGNIRWNNIIPEALK